MTEPASTWLILGAHGMLGRELAGRLGTAPGIRVTAASRRDVDVTDPAAVRAAVSGHDVVVNAAAWTDVDAAEAREAEATAVNGTAVASVAEACAASGSVLVQVSTDYVFAGDASAPYAEDAPTAPLNAYGRGKLVAEEAVLGLLPDRGYVVRTAWLYGEFGGNFVTTMRRLAGEREFVDVVDDQRGQPTWASDLAGHLIGLGRAALAGRAPSGIYHGTASGEATWYDLARAVFELSGWDPARVRPTTSGAFVRPAKRPSYSVLGHDRWAAAGMPAMRDWHAALTEALASPGFRKA